MPRLIIHEGGKKRIYEICEDLVTIGSGPQNNIRLKDSKTVASHCQVKRTSMGFHLVDLETKAGTRVNSRFVNQHLLKNGDKISIGNAVIVYQDAKKKIIDLPDAATRSAIRRAEKEKEKFPPWAIGLIIGSCGLAAAIFIFLVFRQVEVPQDPAERYLMDAREAFFKENDKEKASAFFQKYEEEARKRELGADIQLFAKQVKALLEKGVEDEKSFDLDQEAYKKLRSFQSWCFKHPYKIEDAMKRADEYLEMYGETQYADMVRKFRRVIDPETHRGKSIEEIEAACDAFTQAYRDAENMFNYMVNEVREKYSKGGFSATMSPNEAYQNIMEKVFYKIDRLRYGDAMKYCDEFIRDYPDSDRVEEARKKKEWILEVAKMKYEELEDWCREYENKKDFRAAIGVYRDKVENRFGIPEYVEKAKRERERLEVLHNEKVQEKIKQREAGEKEIEEEEEGKGEEEYGEEE